MLLSRRAEIASAYYSPAFHVTTMSLVNPGTGVAISFQSMSLRGLYDLSDIVLEWGQIVIGLHITTPRQLYVCGKGKCR